MRQASGVSGMPLTNVYSRLPRETRLCAVQNSGWEHQQLAQACTLVRRLLLCAVAKYYT